MEAEEEVVRLKSPSLGEDRFDEDIPIYIRYTVMNKNIYNTNNVKL